MDEEAGTLRRLDKGVQSKADQRLIKAWDLEATIKSVESSLLKIKAEIPRRTASAGEFAGPGEGGSSSAAIQGRL